MSEAYHDYSVEFPHPKYKIPFEEREDIKLPDGANMVVNFYVALEWWGRIYYPKMNEKIQYDIDDAEIVDMSGLSFKENYNYEVGVWRILEVLDRNDIKASFLISASGAKKYPELVVEIADRGHEIVGHGIYQSRGGADMSPEREKEDIRKSAEIIEDIVGERPLGWVYPGARFTEHTFKFLVDEGYYWHGGVKDDDIPYIIDVDGETLVEIPFRTISANDYAIFSKPSLSSPTKGLRDPKEAINYFQNVFDSYKKTALNEPVMLTTGSHPYASGTPDRIVVIDEMFKYIKDHSDVWMGTYGDLAHWWHENHFDKHSVV